MTDIHIPPEAGEAAARAIFRVGFERETLEGDAADADRLAFARRYATAAIRAALEAWPGMNHDSQAWRGYGGEVLILPMTEPRDD